MVMFDNAPTKKTGTQTESKKLIDKKVWNSNEMVDKSTQYTLTDIPLAKESVLQPFTVKFRRKAKPKFKDIGVNTDSYNKPNFDNYFNYGSETESNNVNKSIKKSWKMFLKSMTVLT